MKLYVAYAYERSFATPGFGYTTTHRSLSSEEDLKYIRDKIREELGDDYMYKITIISWQELK